MKKQTNHPTAGRKLNLNKKTISNLAVSEMGKHVGGSTGCYPHYPTGYSKNRNTCPGHKTC